MKERILEMSHSLWKDTVSWRRHLHENPEMSFKEYKTSAFVEEKLKSWGIPCEKMVETGVVGIIKGKNPDKATVALRGDMDALPIVEENQKDYASKNPGVMHACGHDVHTSSLLASAKILNELREEFEGSIKLIFQPGEERIPGGAKLMIEEGVLEDPRPLGVFGQHVMPFLPAGTVGFRKGMYMASADEVYLEVIGKGGHAAVPERNIDPVIVTAQILVSLQQLVSRNARPAIPSVLSFGKVIANGATNIIPDRVHVEGTFRTMDEEWRAEAHQKIVEIAEGIAKSFGATCKAEVRKGYPYLENNAGLTERASAYAKELLGEDKVVDLEVWLAGEDFAYFSQATDACFYRLGTANEEKGITSNVHTPTFDIDEDALKIGPALMSWIAINELKFRSE